MQSDIDEKTSGTRIRKCFLEIVLNCLKLSNGQYFLLLNEFQFG